MTWILIVFTYEYQVEGCPGSINKLDTKISTNHAYYVLLGSVGHSYYSMGNVQ